MQVSVNSLKGRDFESMRREFLEVLETEHMDMMGQIAFRSAIFRKFKEKGIEPLEFLVIEEDWASFCKDRSYIDDMNGVDTIADVKKIVEVFPPKLHKHELRFAGKDNEWVEDVYMEVTIDNYDHDSSAKIKYQSEQGFNIWIDIDSVMWKLHRNKLFTRYSQQKDKYSRARNPELVWGYRFNSALRTRTWGSASTLNHFTAYLTKKEFNLFFKEEENV